MSSDQPLLISLGRGAITRKICYSLSRSWSTIEAAIFASEVDDGPYKQCIVKVLKENPQLTLCALLDHYSKPRNVGSMAKNDNDVGTGLVGAPACGDVMKLQIRVDPNDNTISDVKFKTFGCGSAIASSSYLTELVRGMTLENAGKIRNTEIAKELCLPPVKLHCSMLAEDAIKSAISNYYTKNPKAKSTNLGGTDAAIPKIDVETVIEPSSGQTATA
ncbi:MAG: iron-binding protein [Candelina submexicana]|nr:MAG: iron-binding protein [Candelina submexicana]